MCSWLSPRIWIYHLSFTEAKPQVEACRGFHFSPVCSFPPPHSVCQSEGVQYPGRPSTRSRPRSGRRHSMSALFRLSSSSDTVRFPRYQNIQKNVLRKMSRGPDNTKKSQKLKGAKIPTKKRTRPTTSKMMASARKKPVQLPSFAMAGPGEADAWMLSEGLTGVRASVFRKVASCLLDRSCSLAAHLAFLS